MFETLTICYNNKSYCAECTIESTRGILKNQGKSYLWEHFAIKCFESVQEKIFHLFNVFHIIVFWKWPTTGDSNAQILCYTIYDVMRSMWMNIIWYICKYFFFLNATLFLGHILTWLYETKNSPEYFWVLYIKTNSDSKIK